MPPPAAPAPQPPSLPPVSRGVPWWGWLLIVTGALSMLAALGAVGAFVYALSTEDDDWVDPGYYDGYWVEQESVIAAVEDPCAAMADAAAELRLFAGPAEGAESLRDYVATIDEIVATVDAHQPDLDSRKWRNDWVSLAEALETYVDELSEPGATFTMPSAEDGYPLSWRMYDGSPEGCAVPIVIEALDPDLAAYVPEMGGYESV